MAKTVSVANDDQIGSLEIAALAESVDDDLERRVEAGDFVLGGRHCVGREPGTQDQFSHPHLEGAQKWQSAMTYKFVGALKGIINSQPHVLKALQLGIVLGLVVEIARKLIKSRPGYKKFATGSRTGRITDFLLDAVLLSSPYASSFGGFVELPTILWWPIRPI